MSIRDFTMNNYPKKFSSKPEIPRLVFEPVSPMKSSLYSMYFNQRKRSICEEFGNEDPKKPANSKYLSVVLRLM